jgi:perosamine synthetase
MAIKIPVARPTVSRQEVRTISAVIRSGMLAQRSIVEEFEHKFADYVGVKEAIALCNGTAALDIALKAAGISAGDEVVTTDFSFIASANAILYQKATPVFVDMKRGTFNIDPHDLREKILKKRRKLFSVSIFLDSRSKSRKLKKSARRE